MMIRHWLAVAALSMGIMATIQAYAQPTSAQSQTPRTALHKIDTNADGTISWAEATTAARKKFAALDVDHDGTLDAAELKGRLGPKQFQAAESDKDGTLDMTEYLAVAKARFNAADTDHDGTLSLQELRSPKGRAFLQLVQY